MKSKIIALILILLIADIPIYVSAGMAIHHHVIAGEDGIHEIVRKNDVLDAKVLVTGGENVSADQLWLGSNIPFDTCTKDINGTLCILKFPASGKRAFEKKEYYSINLHSSSHASPPTSKTLIDSKFGYLVVDAFPPRINVDLKYQPNSTKAELSFEAFDDSYAQSKYDVCAGLKTIEFVVANTSKIFDYEAKQCHAKESFSLELSNLADGQHEIYVYASDQFGHNATSKLELSLDRTGVQFSNFALFNSYGKELKLIGNNQIDAKINLDVSNDVNINTIKADLSQLHTGLNDVKGNCVNLGNSTTCKWEFAVEPSTYGDKSIVFKGYDKTGNYREQNFSVSLTRDIEGPKIISIKTSIEGDDGKFYLKPYDNNITVEFSESGAGIDTIFLDLSDFGSSQKIEPSFCDNSSKCYWNNLNFAASDGAHEISVNPDTRDKLGNKLNESFSQEVILDTKAPQIISLSVETVGGEIDLYEDLTTSGDSLQIIAVLKEDSILKETYGDFSAFISNANNVLADECQQKENGLWECTWLTDPIDMSGYIKDTLKFTFNDFLGNKGYYERELSVIGIQGSYTDYWKYTVSCSPSSIDREVTSLIDQRIYCHVRLRGNAEMRSLEMGKCSSEASYLRGVELVNHAPGARDVYLKLNLQAADVYNGTLSVNCPLIITSKSGNTITSIPEIEEVQISISFFNNPLGEYGKNIKRKADDAVDEANGKLWKIITALNKIVFYAERICSLITTVANVASLFSLIGAFGKDVADWTGNVPLWQASTQQQTVAEVINNEQIKGNFLGMRDEKNFVNKFCKFVSCRLFYDEWGDKAQGGDGGALGSLGNWQRTVLKYANLVATGGPLGEKIGLGGQGVNAYTYEGSDLEHGIAPNIYLEGGKLNPKDSIVLSFATLCIPGIVYNLDKYRQIKCMYADCLLTSVDTGVPIKSCEDLKDYQTCKYMYGELFQLMPFTGLLDYVSGLIKGILYSPLSIIDVVLGYACTAPINSPGGQHIAKVCLAKEIAGIIADVWSDIANFKDNWKIKNDYCSRIKETKNETKEKKSAFGGIFS